MLNKADFLLRARLDAASLEAWVEAGWLTPRAGCFRDLDVAHAHLIRDLREDLGVNNEGVAVALDLLDQLHGARLALRRILAVLQTLPEPLRHEVISALRAPSVGAEPVSDEGTDA